MAGILRTGMKLLKGCLIGSSIVVPGVSGGSMAMSMGIYESIVGFASARRRSSAREGRALIPYAAGVITGIVLFSYFIELALAAYPLQTAGAFVGLILGVLPMLLRQVRGHRVRATHLLLLLCTAGLLVAMPLMSGAPGAYTLVPSLPHALLALGLGFIAAATMVIPGVSGSMLLLLLGCYDSTLQHVNGFVAALFRLDGAGLLQHAAILLPFCAGAALGIVLTARLIKAVLRRYPLSTYYAILGLVLGSPFAVIYQQELSALTPGGGLAALACAAAGFCIAALLGKGESEP